MNSQSLIFTALLSIGLHFGSNFSAADDQKPDSAKSPIKTREITAGDLKIAVPESWKERRPKSQMRVAEFEVPPAKGDKQSGEFVVFYFQGQGGGLSDNIARWVGQIEPKGRSVNVRKGKCELGDYAIVDVTGVYKKSVGPPALGKTERLEGWRVVNVFLACDNGPYFFKIDGPEQTVAEQFDGLRATFGGDAETEEEQEYEAK